MWRVPDRNKKKRIYNESRSTEPIMKLYWSVSALLVPVVLIAISWYAAHLAQQIHIVLANAA